jgi:hypothetical protein
MSGMTYFGVRVGLFASHSPAPKNQFREPIQFDQAVQPAALKNSSLRKSENILSSLRPAPREGRYAIVTNVGAGCGGREGLQRGVKPASTKRPWRTVKPCGPDTPTLVPSLRAIRRRWWLTSPVHQGERGAAVKTIAQGMPDCLGCPVVACVRKVHFLCTQGSRVRPTSGIPCALCLMRDNALQDSGRSCRGIVDACSLDCRAPRKRGIQYTAAYRF